MINMLKNLMGKISHINEEMQDFNRDETYKKDPKRNTRNGKHIRIQLIG